MTAAAVAQAALAITAAPALIFITLAIYHRKGPTP